MTASVRKHTAQHLLLRRPQPRNTIKPRPTQPRQSIYKLQPPRRATWPRPIRRWPILPPAQRNIVVVVQLTKRVHRTSRVRLWQRQQPQMRPHPISRTTVRRRPIVLQRLWYQSPPTRSRRHSLRSRQQQHLQPRGLQVEEAGLMLRPLRVHRSPPLKRCKGRQSLTSSKALFKTCRIKFTVFPCEIRKLSSPPSLLLSWVTTSLNGSWNA